jgi:CRISPR-associated endonuclease Csy4
MDHYMEIRLLPDPEFAPTVLMNALFAKLHRVLAVLDSNAIGISFPDAQQAQPALGDRLRLHGTSDELQRLIAQNWLTGIRDHITINEPTPVPAKVSYRKIRRVQTKSNPERLRRRLMKRKGITAEEARRIIPDSAAKQLKLPFVTIKSRSTGQEFRLFIDHQPLENEPSNGEFNWYGLSTTATVPWF